MRSTWTRCRPNCCRWSTRRSSRPRPRCGFDHRRDRWGVAEGESPHPIRHERLHAMQFRPAPLPLVRGGRSAQRPSWSDRECPLVTAGDRCLWHVGGRRPVGTMWFAPVGEGSPLPGRCGSARVTTVSLASCEAARQPVAGRITVSRAACSAALGGAHATTTPGSDNRERRGDQPSRRSLIFRGASGPDRHPSPTREDAPHQYVQPTFISFCPRIINPLGLRDKWD